VPKYSFRAIQKVMQKAVPFQHRFNIDLADQDEQR
jgi:hypothetical protein